MLYDVQVALRRFRGLIKYTARKYAVRGHFRIGMEEIEAEGYLTLVQCCRSFPEGQRRFARYFKRAWSNRLKKLIRFGFQQKRQGFEVDLEKAQEVQTPEISSEVWERLSDRAYQLMPLLTENARRLLQQLLEPSEEVFEYAWRDYCRKNKLHSQGIRVPGWRYFRVKPRHISGVLHMSATDMQMAVREIRRANHQTQRRSRG